jgi:predicted RNase H-like HicB family nuclease
MMNSMASRKPSRASTVQGTYIVSTVCVRGRKLRLHLHFDEDGGFWVNSPDMKGLVTQGETTDEAVSNGVDAACALMEARAKTSARSVGR